jgi:tryptophanyl-tRNA synthetase
VGKDQEQHLEMTRNFAVRFNHKYGTDFFPEPQAFDFSGELIKVPGLDGSGKMGKSEAEGNAIFLREDADVIRKKVMRAKTDAGPTELNSVKSAEIQNLFTLLKLVSKPETLALFEETYNNCTIRYGDLKKQLAEDIIAFTSPLKEKILELEKNDNLLKAIAREGAEKARVSAKKTLDGVHEIMGLKSIWL